jgi:hypothetical protein
VKKGDKERKALDCIKKYFISSDIYGLATNEILKLNEILQKAVVNKDLSSFPDFLLDNGFIEHFQITSSKETRKGSKHLKDFSNYRKRVVEIRRQLILKNITNFARSKFWYSGHSYENLKSSFIKNWQSHMESLSKFKGKQDVGIFLIQYMDEGLEMFENAYDRVETEIRIPVRDALKLDDYYLSKDKYLLSYIEQFRDRLKYVIFMNCEKIEVIKLDKISEIQKLLPWGFFVAPIGGVRTDYIYPLDLNCLFSRKGD